jgi:hypothetical protein
MIETQSEIISKMTPQDKLKAAMNLYWSARQLKASWLRQLHPDWSLQQVDKMVKEIFLHARS